MRFLHENLVIVPTDKASNNATLVCKSLFLKILADEFANSGTYDEVSESLAEVVKAHLVYLQPKYLMGSHKLGYLYASPKMHKSTPKQRFIAALADCTTTRCSKLLAKSLALILRTLRLKDDNHIRRTGIRRFFVVDGYEEVATFVHNYRRVPSTTPHLYTGDFSTMYTGIPHEDLIDRVSDCIDEAWEYQAGVEGLTSNLLHISTSHYCDTLRMSVWTRSNRPDLFSSSRWSIGRETLKDLVRFLVNNTYILNGSVIRR